jgi:hypothetical protein
MERITYILGAGFSAPAGLPLMNNFILKAKDVYYKDPSKFNYFTRIFNKIEELAKIKNFFKSDLFDIEEVLSLFETEAILYRNTKFRTEFIRFISDVIEFYTFDNLEIKPIKDKSFHGHILGNNQIKKNYASFVCNIAGLKISKLRDADPYNFEINRISDSDKKYSIITLNYDTILENCLDSIINIYLNNDGTIFNLDKYDSSWDNPHLIKLHGCVKNKNIIPPTWAKSMSKNIEKVWRNAYNVIKDSTQIRFIGYSLPITDSNVRYLIKSGILKNQTLKKIDAICLDNLNQQVKLRYDDFIDFNYYDFRNINSKDYLKKIGELSLVPTRLPNEVVFNSIERVHLEFFK